ncbi:MAG: exopolyphosphatase [Desulfuromusa sp.]|nr:exopolyphosphatase [Desulfuromusa sp.]
MHAVIDVGSNTIRMLLGECRNGIISPYSYHREVTRLAGNFSVQTGLAAAAMERALKTLQSYQKIIAAADVSHVRAVATAALRKANNRHTFIARVVAATGLKVEVIAGEEEALLTTRGVLSVIDPTPDNAIVIDIGGGSVELVSIVAGEIRLQKSYPFGVVTLCEDYSSASKRQQPIDTIILQFTQQLQQLDLAGLDYQFIGTAGTITTLAAIHLQLQRYNPELINNYELSVGWLSSLQQKMELLSVSEREALPGMEKGRGDLILPGLQILLTLMQQFQFSKVKVSDCGLLEGVMLRLTGS